VVDVRDWLVVLAVGLGTYAFRSAFRRLATSEPPAAVRRALGYVAPAVLAAIAVPALVHPEGAHAPADPVTGLAAGLTCWLVWHRWRSFPIALAAGAVAGLVVPALVRLAG
jgi:branched-subunit amino acid transport protein